MYIFVSLFSHISGDIFRVCMHHWYVATNCMYFMVVPLNFVGVSMLRLIVALPMRVYASFSHKFLLPPKRSRDGVQHFSAQLGGPCGAAIEIYSIAFC